MTNREKLLNTNIYDLLISMNKTIIQESHFETCVLDALEEKRTDCEHSLCSECLQEYLNKEV